ncbi:MAG: ABC transporter substrate-binding protein [Archangium sp.]|nr:ABC transporter substrate-binding protein [Archangium sp.]
MRCLFALLLVFSACTCKRGGGVDAGPDADWLAGRVVVLPGTPRDGGTLTVRLPIEPVGLTRLHDRFNEGTMTRVTVGPVYETLGRVREGQLTPLLAQAWSESDDHLTLRVTLRSDVRFHDGQPLTSADVKATLDVLFDPKNATSGFRSALQTLDRVEAPDATTVVIHWKEPYFLATWTLLGALPVLPAHGLVGEFDTLPLHRAPIGTGPFRFEKWEAGTSMAYVRNDAYWGRRAYLERVVFRFVKDDTAAVAGWERGDFDLITRLSPTAWRGSESNPRLQAGYQRVFFPENTYVWLGFNHRKQPFADPRVRKALGLLFPMEQVERTVDLGLEPRTTCPYFPGSMSCDPRVTPLPFDPPAAKRLLGEAGWADSDGDGVLDRAGERFTLAFLAAAQSPKMTKLLPLYLDTLESAGIDARIETVDVSGYMSRVRAHDFDAMALSWSAADSVQDNFQNFHSSQIDGGSNYVGYSNPEVDQLLTRIRAEFDPGKRAALEREVHRRVYEDQAYLFLGRRPALDAFKRTVRGLQPSLGWYDLSAVWISD